MAGGQGPTLCQHLRLEFQVRSQGKNVGAPEISKLSLLALPGNVCVLWFCVTLVSGSWRAAGHRGRWEVSVGVSWCQLACSVTGASLGM